MFAKCSCTAGGYVDQKAICVHTLVPLYLFTLLLTSGYLAEHILLALTTKWNNSWDIALRKDGNEHVFKTAICKLIEATGVYNNIQSVDKCTVRSLLKKFTVGTESAKKIIHCYPDPSLMRPLQLLPNLATKLVRKRGMA